MNLEFFFFFIFRKKWVGRAMGNETFCWDGLIVKAVVVVIIIIIIIITIPMRYLSKYSLFDVESRLLIPFRNGFTVDL